MVRTYEEYTLSISPNISVLLLFLINNLQIFYKSEEEQQLDHKLGIRIILFVSQPP